MSGEAARRRGRAAARAAAGLAAVLAVAAACDEAAVPAQRQDGAVLVTDDAGREVHLDSAAGRVVSLAPAITDLILLLGAEDRLIARTDYDTAAAIAELPSVGGGLTPSLEWIVRREPDLVIAWPDQGARSLVDRLEDLGVPVFASAVETLEQGFTTTRRIGLLLGLEERADALVARWRARIEEVDEAVEDLPPPTVAYVIGLDPPMLAGPETFADELIEIAGGRNAFGDAASRWPQVSLEELVRRQPDYLVLTTPPGSPGPERLRGMAGWRELTAVREGRVARFSPDLFNRFPHAPAAARLLAETLHPAALDSVP